MMRMWNVPVNLLCRQHLLGEHAELHMFLGSFKKGIRLIGYIGDGLLDPETLHSRHEQLAQELSNRNYKHKSPLNEEMADNLKKAYKKAHVFLSVNDNLKELSRRCKTCKEKIDQYVIENNIKLAS